MDEITAADFERDFYFRVPHPHLAWSILAVNVRHGSDGWQFAYGYQFPEIGMGSPFEGRLPSRESAGRIGLIRLRDALRRFAGDKDIDRDRDQKLASKYADQIQEQLFPSQLELGLA